MFAFDTKCAQIRPHLFLGAAPHEADYALLRRHNVTHILQVGVELRPSFPDRFTYLRVAIDDAEVVDIVSILPRCFAFIEGARTGLGSAYDHAGTDAHYQSLRAKAAKADPQGAGQQSPSDSAKQRREQRRFIAQQRPGHELSMPADVDADEDAPQGVVLVHCMAGMSRSASVVVAYLMWREQLRYEEAFKQVKTARPCIYPNLGFLLQLWEWEAGGCRLEGWGGWGKHRLAERLAEYRRVQLAMGLHPAVRVRLVLPSWTLAETQGEASAAATSAPILGAPPGGDGAPSAAGTPAPAGTPGGPGGRSEFDHPTLRDVESLFTSAEATAAASASAAGPDGSATISSAAGAEAGGSSPAASCGAAAEAQPRPKPRPICGDDAIEAAAAAALEATEEDQAQAPESGVGGGEGAGTEVVDEEAPASTLEGCGDIEAPAITAAECGVSAGVALGPEAGSGVEEAGSCCGGAVLMVAGAAPQTKLAAMGPVETAGYGLEVKC